MRRRFRGWIAAIVAGTAILGGGALLLLADERDPESTGSTAKATPAQTPVEVVANGWIVAGATDGTRCATPVAYDDSAECRFGSFDAFYQAAQCGDGAYIRPGQYGEMELWHDDDETPVRSASCSRPSPAGPSKPAS